MNETSTTTTTKKQQRKGRSIAERGQVGAQPEGVEALCRTLSRSACQDGRAGHEPKLPDMRSSARRALSRHIRQLCYRGDQLRSKVSRHHAARHHHLDRVPVSGAARDCSHIRQVRRQRPQPQVHTQEQGPMQRKRPSTHIIFVYLYSNIFFLFTKIQNTLSLSIRFLSIAHTNRLSSWSSEVGVPVVFVNCCCFYVYVFAN